MLCRALRGCCHFASSGSGELRVVTVGMCAVFLRLIYNASNGYEALIAALSKTTGALVWARRASGVLSHAVIRAKASPCHRVLWAFLKLCLSNNIGPRYERRRRFYSPVTNTSALNLSLHFATPLRNND